MTLDAVLDALPGYAQDLKLSFAAALQQSELTPQQLWGTLVASAFAARHRGLLLTLTKAAQPYLSAEATQAAKTAASLMAMNNIYYRFHHLADHPPYAAIPSRLRRNGTRTHGVALIDFELWCTAASALNGCGVCVAAHEKKLRTRGVAEETILAAVRLASIIHGIAVVMDAEDIQADAGV